MNLRMLFDSRMAFSDSASRRAIVGTASAKRPCSVRTQKERFAPATRKRELSDFPLRSFSSEMAQVWSEVAQWQGLPFSEHRPWPNWVTLNAVQLCDDKAAIRPATTLVLPTFRECPPITMMAIGLYQGTAFSGALVSRQKSPSSPTRMSGLTKSLLDSQLR